MGRTSLLASVLALQSATGAYALPQARLRHRDGPPGEPPVFEGPTVPANQTGLFAYVDSPHFRIWLGPSKEADAASGIQKLEAAYDCFVGRHGWRTTGLSVRDAAAQGPYRKTEMYSVADLGSRDYRGYTHYGNRAWIQVQSDLLNYPELTVHEYGHALHWHQGNAWPSLTNSQAWSEAVANWAADSYLTTDLCADSRAKYNQTEGETVFRVYRTVEASYLTIVDATDLYKGNHYDAFIFFHYLVRNPDGWHGLGRDAVLALIRATPQGDNAGTPLHALRRVLNGTATVNEVVGKYWARMAYVDVDHPQALRLFNQNQQFLNMQNFEKLDEAGRYKVKAARAPRYMGASMAPLKTDGNATTTVGVSVKAPAGPFTATLSVRDKASGKVRYVALPDGAGSADVAAGEEATLVVANTPAELLEYDGNRLEGTEANKGLEFSFTITGATVAMY